MPMTSKSSTITKARKATRSYDTLAHWNIHPGEILREEFLRPMSLSVYQLAKNIHVPAPRINDIVLEKRGITADTAVRLARYFGTTEQFWMNLQSSYDVRKTKAEIGKKIEKIKPRSESQENVA